MSAAKSPACTRTGAPASSSRSCHSEQPESRAARDVELSAVRFCSFLSRHPREQRREQLPDAYGDKIAWLEGACGSSASKE